MSSETALPSSFSAQLPLGQTSPQTTSPGTTPLGKAVLPRDMHKVRTQPADLFSPSIKPGRAEKTFAVLGLLLPLGGFDYILSILGNIGYNRSQGNPYAQIVLIAFALPAIYLAWKNHRAETLKLLASAWPLLILLVYCLVSVAWSVEPPTAIRRAGALLLTSGFALYLAVRYTPEDLIRILSIALAVIIASGFIAAAIPGVGIHPSGSHQGKWRGLAGHKNNFGRYIGLALVVFAFNFYQKTIPRLHALAAIAACILLLYMSDSKTPVICACLAIALMPLYRFLIRAKTFTTGVKVFMTSATLAVLVPTVLVAGPLILEALGRDATLTGRDTIWNYAIQKGLERPVLGAGYRTFWVDRITGDFLDVNIYFHDKASENADEIMGNGHNGYLDVWLELGSAGAALYLLFTLSMYSRFLIWNTAAQNRDHQDPSHSQNIENARKISVLFAALLTFYTVYSLTETVILAQGELFWTIISTAYLAAVHYRQK